jgi:hypothetical protein
MDVHALPGAPEEGMEITTYFVAGIDVHKRMLAVVVADAGREGEFHFEKRVLIPSGPGSGSRGSAPQRCYLLEADRLKGGGFRPGD